MITIDTLRKTNPAIIVLGSHSGVIQSILDYDFLLGRETPSITVIVARGRKLERYFWGDGEIVLPVVPTLDEVQPATKQQCTVVINVQSARRVLRSTTQAIEQLPNVKLLNIFAEQTPEAHAIELARLATEHDVTIVGPSSVGVLIPGVMKIGAIGGTQYRQLIGAKVMHPGNVAVISTSGGMVNELIHTVTGSGHKVSFAMALGGDRNPITDPMQAMLLAEKDAKTDTIVYFGELGGTDEYEIAQLIDDGKLTKKVVAYVAGVVAELFDTPPQFGHAKALAESYDESASAKKKRLSRSGVTVVNHISDIATELGQPGGSEITVKYQDVSHRKRRPFISHISGDRAGDVQLLGNDLLTTVEANTIPSLVLSMLLGKQVASQKAIAFTDLVLRMLVDHGPYVSGAVNTIITARAGRDLVSSLAAGLLTIGPRFGGAVNDASQGWLDGVTAGMTAKEYVDQFARQGVPIQGIGHKKYRVDTPDPRVSALASFTGNSNGDRYYKFAQSVADITTNKKANLILNVDGAIGAIMLDILESELHYSETELRDLVAIEFFNALFVLSRSVGFTAHFLDQRRHEEGLFRLATDDLRYMG